jgi:hypothetical protein
LDPPPPPTTDRPEVADGSVAADAAPEPVLAVALTMP